MTKREEEKPVRVIEDKKHKGMYRLEWEDGTMSIGTSDPKPWEKGGHYGFYNLTRANDILKNYDLYVSSMERSERMFGLETPTHQPK